MECAFFLSCEGKDSLHDEIINIPSEDTTIRMKISYQEKWIKNDKIIIWSRPTLQDKFYPDSITNNRDLWLCPILKQKLLEAGYLNIEYIGRNDSIMFNNFKYRTSDTNTKAVDLENLLNYIHTNKQLKNKKIILVGHSEGGTINSIVASKKQSEVSAIVQLASNAVGGKENIKYQRLEQNSFDEKLRFSYIIKYINKWSSLDSHYKVDTLILFDYGLGLFIKEHINRWRLLLINSIIMIQFTFI
jgi:hypothetical protein